jgi:hypothetical protein
VGPDPVDQPVEVVDNGARCFIPPCFSFDLRDTAGTLVATVSQVVLEAEVCPGAQDFDAIDALRQPRMLALGAISDYDPGPEAREVGRRFTKKRVVPPGTNTQHG